MPPPVAQPRLAGRGGKGRPMRGDHSEPQPTHRKGFGGPTVQGSGSVEDRAVHHTLARPADGQRQSPLRAVQPVLQDAGQGGVRSKEVG